MAGSIYSIFILPWGARREKPSFFRIFVHFALDTGPPKGYTSLRELRGSFLCALTL